jgi:hypothetical protein
LRSTFRRLVTSAGLVTGTGRAIAGGCCPASIDPIEVTQRIDARAPNWAALVAACRADDSGCTPLCKQFVSGSPDAPPSITECYIVDIDRTRGVTDVHVTYYLPEEPCIAGRRPPGLLAPSLDPLLSERATWLAGIAHLEAASIPAFLLLARDLERASAPASLIRASHAAAADEVRHARMISTLARAAGATLPAVTLAPTSPRSLLDLALDNATEGCVRESFAALLATHQAAHAADPLLRRAFAVIAVDETRHAALAFAVDAWLAPRLTVAERATVAAARRAALADLSAAPLSPALAHAAGWPTGHAARHLLSAFRTI